MKTIEIKPQTLISLKTFDLSIGKTESDIAIFSKHTGEFIKLSQTLRSKKLKSAKRTFKMHLCSKTDFCFSFMGKDDTMKLIEILSK